jgi:hypothetical protein
MPIDASTPQEEKPTLDKMAREQDRHPEYRFSTANSAGFDPGEETEALEDAEPPRSARTRNRFSAPSCAP